VNAAAQRAVWRWHFYAGLFAAPVLIVLALTGALYLFDREIDHAWNRSLDTVAVSGDVQSLAAQEAAVLAAHPGARMLRVTLPVAEGRASRWLLQDAHGSEREVFVDPYTARLQGAVDPKWQPMKLVRSLHGTLLTGQVGSHVVELAACWTLLMLVTGAVLWWPATWRPGVLVPRTRARGRAFWRDWHALPALFNAVLVAGLVMTGLPWSAFWGQQFARLGTVLPFVAPSPNFSAHLPGHAPAEGVPWTIQHAGADAHHGHAQTPHAQQTATVADVEALLPTLDMDRHGTGLRVFYPEPGRSVFMASYVPDRAQGQRTLYVDAAAPTVDIGWDDYSPVARAVEWGVSTHVGRQYGRVNQFANLAVCLALIGSLVAALVMWWRRRPPGSLGSPARGADDRLPRPLALTIAVMAVLFPLLGASILLVLGLRKVRLVAGRPRP
jgi:uncharacterized iron-regulated membrane protein